jgi:quaternary ammonium compound-resistance protein SugE
VAPWKRGGDHPPPGRGAVAGSQQVGQWKRGLAWIVLIISGVLEAVWATALGRSEGFSKPGPTLVFALAIIASMAGLAYAMRTLSIGTAYAVWVGIGAALTIIYAMATGSEPASLLKVLFLLMIIGGVVGLKLIS